MKKITFIFLLIAYSFSFAQEKYKYIIVPNKFDFFNKENKYNTSFISKSFFEKENFKVYYDTDALPTDLVKNRCDALFLNAIENNNLFVTKITFELKDCFGSIIYTSKQGISREKDFAKAYTDAFRQALSSMSGKLNLKKAQDVGQAVISKESNLETVQVELEQNKAFEPNTNQLFAIPTATGYKLVNDKPETVFLLNKTSDSAVFTAVKGGQNGVFIKKSNSWFFEYYEGENLISERVEVKF